MARLYAALRSAVVACRKNGDSWQATQNLTAHEYECLAAHPAVPERVFLGTAENGLYRLTDGTLTQCGTGTIAQDRVTAVTIDPTDPETVWVGTEPSRLYRSTDGGDHWEQVPGLTEVPSAPEWSFPPRPDTHHVRRIAVDHADPTRLYLGIEAGAFVIYDATAGTFEDRPPGARRDIHWIATHPDAPARVYTAAGDGYAESTDHGRHWTHPQQGLAHRYVWGLGVDPGDPETILVSAAHGASDAHRQPGNSWVYRHQDGTWERLADCGLPTGADTTRAVFDGGAAGEFVALSNHGLYHSTDQGDTWRACDVDWPLPITSQTAQGVCYLPEA